MSKLSLVIGREYRERVAKKSFIITTILMPLVMLALTLAPALIMMYSTPDKVNVLVVDPSGTVANTLVSDEEAQFIPASTDNPDEALALYNSSDEYDALLVIPADVVDRPRSAISYYSNGPTGVGTEQNICSQINQRVRDERLARENIQNIDSILARSEADVSLRVVRTDKEEEEQASTDLSAGLGIGLAMVLYMFLLLYGQSVMTSIIEEKGNRVLEVVVSSVRPVELMMGKILGIALVALTQIVIWGLLLAAMSVFLLPVLISPEMAAEIAASQAGEIGTSTAVDALRHFTDLGWIMGMMGIMTAYLVLGFLLYASLYAAFGSAVDNIQDAGQLQMFVVLPIIFGIIGAVAAASNPASGMAFWLSMIPFTSPMVMMARLPFGIPEWEICVSLAVLFLSFLVTVWASAKIFRIGIFMYGKKPNIKEIVRWMRYR